MPTLTVERTYLEMADAAWLRAATSDAPGLRLERVTACPPAFYRFLYGGIGAAHHWVDRSRWSDTELRTHLARPDVSLFVLYAAGAPAGYFELLHHDDRSTEIAYFGLFEDFHGRGLGAHLLTLAVREAFRSSPTRVWLHTCSLDHPAALPNYQKRGFRPIKREIYAVERPLTIP